VATIAATRRMASASATDVPPNFRTLWRHPHRRRQHALRDHLLGVQHGGNRAAHGVVAEREELVAENRHERRRPTVTVMPPS
jgi:hypothetical protein